MRFFIFFTMSCKFHENLFELSFEFASKMPYTMLQLEQSISSAEEKIESFKNEIYVLDKGENIRFECFTKTLMDVDKLSIEEIVNVIPMFNRMQRKLELSCSIMQEKQKIVKWEGEMEELTYKKGSKMKREMKMLTSKRSVKYLRKIYERNTEALGGKEAEEKVEEKAEELKIEKVKKQEKMDLS
ncbi:hypothetical protein OS493_019571 [Desmophyllum pertusum]|uniref:Uncharacterized protein n=1 Tax=Desmophyllum pertusum TaxID=174260 RepID=A0A9W9ZP10_9CNID|nr:hypothetical protein OS493_019571 [Desmophyllum pertusum]